MLPQEKMEGTEEGELALRRWKLHTALITLVAELYFIMVAMLRPTQPVILTVCFASSVLFAASVFVFVNGRSFFFRILAPSQPEYTPLQEL